MGQLLWCLAHTLWIGNSFMVVTSAALMAHHAFGCWHGDARLRQKWGQVRTRSLTPAVCFGLLALVGMDLPIHILGYACSCLFLFPGRAFRLRPQFKVAAFFPLCMVCAQICFTGGLRCVQDFEAVKARTSIVPFQAIWEGRQKLPPDYYKEFLRVPYIAVLCTALGAYWAHPLMQRASYWLGW
jgi:uncharacterized membrane protein